MKRNGLLASWSHEVRQRDTPLLSVAVLASAIAQCCLEIEMALHKHPPFTPHHLISFQASAHIEDHLYLHQLLTSAQSLQANLKSGVIFSTYASLISSSDKVSQDCARSKWSLCEMLHNRSPPSSLFIFVSCRLFHGHHLSETALKVAM